MPSLKQRKKKAKLLGLKAANFRELYQRFELRREFAEARFASTMGDSWLGWCTVSTASGEMPLVVPRSG